MTDTGVRIKVFGVGGGGCNAVNRMIEDRVGGVHYYAVNTDAQALENSLSKNKLAIGKLGAGGNPEVGKKCAEENITEIEKAVKDADMVYIACGEGGGTGTGASPVVAKAAKEAGALTVAIVTTPFNFEGSKRMRQAKAGIEELRKHVDSLCIVSNEKLLEAMGKTPMMKAFEESDTVLKRGVQAVTDIILRPSLINLDFADVKYTMQQMGEAVIGIGIAKGENRVVTAAKNALSSPLLEADIKTAKRAIVSITGDDNISLFEVNEAVEKIKELASPDLDIIFGVSTEPSLKDNVMVTVIVTGLEDNPLNENTAENKVLFQTETKESKPQKEEKRIEVVVPEEKELDIPEAPSFMTNENRKPFEEPKKHEEEKRRRSFISMLFEDE